MYGNAPALIHANCLCDSLGVKRNTVKLCDAEGARSLHPRRARHTTLCAAEIAST